MGPFVRYWLPVILYCAFIFVQSSFATPGQLPSFKFSDKLLHLFAYGLLGILFFRAFNSVGRWRHRWIFLFLLSVAATTAYGLSDEWHQSFVAGRNASASDLVADFTGSLVGCGFWLQYLRQRMQSDAP